MPQRDAHSVGDQAVLALQVALPSEWIFRDGAADHGIDGEIEIVDPDGALSGARLRVHVRNTASTGKRGRSGVSVATSTVRRWLTLAVPVVVVRVVGSPLRVSWIEVRDYLSRTDQRKAITNNAPDAVFFDFADALALPDRADALQELALGYRDGLLGMRAKIEADPAVQFWGYVIFVTMFDCDVDAWIAWLQERGSISQLITDLPLALGVKEEVDRDPDLIRRLRIMVEKHFESSEDSK